MNSSYAAFADQVAGAAELVMGKTDDLPAVSYTHLTLPTNREV